MQRQLEEIDRAAACELVRIAVKAQHPRATIKVNADHNIGTPIRVAAHWLGGYHHAVSAPKLINTREDALEWGRVAAAELHRWFDKRMAGSVD